MLTTLSVVYIKILIFSEICTVEIEKLRKEKIDKIRSAITPLVTIRFLYNFACDLTIGVCSFLFCFFFFDIYSIMYV